jgi:hypothetical protein
VLLATSVASVYAFAYPNFIDALASWVPYHSSSGVTKPQPFDDEPIDDALLAMKSTPHYQKKTLMLK